MVTVGTKNALQTNQVVMREEYKTDRGWLKGAILEMKKDLREIRNDIKEIAKDGK